MLSDFYHALDSSEQIGKNIVIPDSSHKALYLSEHGELFCYSGIYVRDKKEVSFQSWPHYLSGKDTKSCEKYIKGFFMIRDGCILLTGFVDHDFYNRQRYKQLCNYVVRMSVVNTCYFGIEKRIETNNSWHFEENEVLTSHYRHHIANYINNLYYRKCFWLRLGKRMARAAKKISGLDSRP